MQDVTGAWVKLREFRNEQSSANTNRVTCRGGGGDRERVARMTLKMLIKYLLKEGDHLEHLGMKENVK